MDIRYYGKAHRSLDVPWLQETQRRFYEEFLQADIPPKERDMHGLQEVLAEVFPIESYDGKYSLEYLGYELGMPRYTQDECRQLQKSYASPLRIRVRLNRTEPVEEWVYLGEMPQMIGGGEFIVNGAERVIVTQIQRSPGVDFSMEAHSSGKILHNCRIIPERGSWIQVEVTARDLLTVRVDRSSKIMATTFLRALSEDLGTDADLLRAFYETEMAAITPRSAPDLVGAVAVSEVVNTETGEVILESATVLTDHILENLMGLGVEELEVIRAIDDPLILNTIANDEAHSHEEAVKRMYARLRPGNPIQLQKARDLMFERFFDPRRYTFGEIGRFRIDRKFGTEAKEEVLSAQDFLNVCAYILKLRAGQGLIDDIDHLENRRVRSIMDLCMDEVRKGLIKLRRGVREQMAIKDVDEVQPHQIINAQAVSSAIDYFFARGELSQVVDQTNPLSQLAHERRLSALGPGGLNRKRAGFEVRDAHPSHYGRICPIETPEGTNIGLIVNLAIYSAINDLGFLVTPYYVVENGVVTGAMKWLRADEERDAYIAQADIVYDKDSGEVKQKMVICRHKEDVVTVPSKMVTFMDISPKQMVGVPASLIPFLEHDDVTRALMGANMQRQAVPLVKPEIPLVGTGMEEYVACNSGMVATAKEEGTVLYADAYRIVVTSKELASGERVYNLHKYKRLNEGTCLNQHPIVVKGDKVKIGQPLTEGAATVDGTLALGSNVLVAFLSWEGYNFEDAILVSQRIIKDDVFTSVHIEEFTTEIRETKVGREEITRDIPGVSENALRNLDDAGLIYPGTRVKPGDILVGKIAPKSKSEYSSEEKLLRAIFGRAGEDVKNDSLIVPPGTEGYVVNVKRFTRKGGTGAEEGRRDTRKLTQKVKEDMQEAVTKEVRLKFERLCDLLGGDPVNKHTGRVLKLPRTPEYDRYVEMNNECQMGDIDCPAAKRKQMHAICLEHDRHIQFYQTRAEVETNRIKRGDELRSGVLEMVKVYVAVKRKLSVGDKMAGRHGNKGVVARVMAEEDMPMLDDGTPVDMVLNPLGVPSRMNVGQILETHLGWAAKTLGFRVVSPVFDGMKEYEIRDVLKEANLPNTGTVVLRDGRTGECFHTATTIGYMYMLKLHHLVADKIHARATGPYSLITQQPLGGKARNGGQRFGEMEVWALEAYGAAVTLQELLTVKSDDVEGRTKIYESMVKGENSLDAGVPVSFEVLCNEIRGLGLNMKIEKDL